MSTLHHSQGKGTRKPQLVPLACWKAPPEPPPPAGAVFLPGRDRSGSGVMPLQLHETSDCFVSTLLKRRLLFARPPTAACQSAQAYSYTVPNNKEMKTEATFAVGVFGGGGAGGRWGSCCCCTQGHQPSMAYCLPSRGANYVNLAEQFPSGQRKRSLVGRKNSSMEGNNQRLR